MRFVGLLAMMLLSRELCAQPAAPHLLWKSESMTGMTAHAFSHSGKILALANDHEIMLWDLQAEQFVRTIAVPSAHYEQIAFTPTDSEIVLLSRLGFGDGAVFCGNGRPEPPVGKEIRVATSSGQVSGVPRSHRTDGIWALSADARYVAVLNDSGELSVRESRAFNTLETVQLREATNGYYPRNIAYSGKRLVVLWRGELTLRDPISLEVKTTPAGSANVYSFTLTNESIFLSHDPRSKMLPVIDGVTGQPSSLQPPGAERRSAEWIGGRMFQVLNDGLLFARGRYLATTYHSEMWSSTTRTSTRTDTLIISSQEHPEGEWNVEVAPKMHLIDVLPDERTLLLSDGNSLETIDVRTHEIKYLTRGIRSLVGFASNGLLVTRNSTGLVALDPATGNRVWAVESIPREEVLLSSDGALIAQAIWHGDMRFYDSTGGLRLVPQSFGDFPKIISYLDDALLIRSQNDVARLYSVPDLSGAKAEPYLGQFSGFIPLGRSRVLAYGGSGPSRDTAVVYDYANERTDMAFVAGLNNGIQNAVLSHDHQWLATATGPDVKLWRVSDGQLKICFRMDGRYISNDAVAFSPNDCYLLYSNDTSVMSYDLMSGESKSVLQTHGEKTITLSRDGSKMAVTGWNEGVAMYEVPSTLRDPAPPINPKSVYLPLRWYLPKDAREALDSNGQPYLPPRTDVVVELRYADGRVLKRIVNGTLHKGKWHRWDFDMTSYPKGTYILHTEIGGVAHDEPMKIGE
ncbi:MAG: WD40 repeat domain-containing protein [Bacteroidota bacterium]|nr:WD40 repeat domain-containing protein [Bacteroidota bacterium]